jgi:hypothetical protein
MPQAGFRIFLSAVNSEFRRARDTVVAADLRSRGLFVKVESDFRQEAGSDTILRKLNDYIRDCDAVVCIIGARSGGLPAPAEAAPFAHMLPDGFAKASYTQWEFFFARHYGKRLSIYIADEDAYRPEDEYQPDPAPADDDPGLQRAFRNYIACELGHDRSYFTNVGELARAILREDWQGRSKTGFSIAGLVAGLLVIVFAAILTVLGIVVLLYHAPQVQPPSPPVPQPIPVPPIISAPPPPPPPPPQPLDTAIKVLPPVWTGENRRFKITARITVAGPLSSGAPSTVPSGDVIFNIDGYDVAVYIPIQGGEAVLTKVLDRHRKVTIQAIYKPGAQSFRASQSETMIFEIP